jgi:hypothetical protein
MFWAWRECRVLALAAFPGHEKLVDWVIAMLFMVPMYYLVVSPVMRRFGKLGHPE